MTDTFTYGVRARVNAGFGLWQLAFGAKDQTLTDSSYSNARAAMMQFTGDKGRVLGIRPTILLVPPTLERAALEVLKATNLANGESNPWKDTAELVVCPYLPG